jgi:Pentapeptide repeats (8 copies)
MNQTAECRIYSRQNRSSPGITMLVESNLTAQRRVGFVIENYTERFDDLDLIGADCSGLIVTNRIFRYCNMRYINFRGADLDSTCFRDCDLSHAKFTNANLDYVKFKGCDLSRAVGIVDGGYRSDGYRFIGWKKRSKLMIRAGCRTFSIDRAKKHWRWRKGTRLGSETTAILKYIETMAKLTGLIHPRT